MVVHLFDNGTPTFSDLTVGSGITVGNGWTTVQQGAVTQLGWYRRATGAGRKPNAVTLWNSAGTKIITTTNPTDSGAVGWQWTDITPVNIDPTLTYYITAAFSTGATRAQNLTNVHQSTPSPVGWTTPISRFVTGVTADSYPTSSDDAANHPVDVTFDPGNTTGIGAPNWASASDVQNAFASWLSVDDFTHADSAPIQDHETLATVDGNVAAIKDQQDEWAFGLAGAAHGYFSDVKGLIANIKTVTDTLPTPIAQLTSIVLDHYTADIDNILAQIDTVLSNLGAQSTDLSGTAGSAVGALSGRTGFPATGWSMSAEADFEDAIAFAEPADAYVLNITSYQDTQPANESPAGLWLPRLGWWCVLNGSLASQRQFVDFQEMLLDDGGRRMPGCAIQLRPGTLATVQAWLLA